MGKRKMVIFHVERISYLRGKFEKYLRENLTELQIIYRGFSTASSAQQAIDDGEKADVYLIGSPSDSFGLVLARWIRFNYPTAAIIGILSEEYPRQKFENESFVAFYTDTPGYVLAEKIRELLEDVER